MDYQTDQFSLGLTLCEIDWPSRFQGGDGGAQILSAILDVEPNRLRS